MENDGKTNRRALLRAGLGAALAGASVAVAGKGALADDYGDRGDDRGDDRDSYSGANRTPDPLPIGAIQSAMHVKGTVDNGVLSFDLSRTDLKPTSLFGVEVDPDFGFDSEISFQGIHGGAIAKWEFCLLDTEVTPVLDALLTAQLQPRTGNVNAIHNHFLRPQPEVKFLHGTAVGDPVKIASALYKALRHSNQPFEPPAPPQNTGLPNQQIANILHGTPHVTGKILRVDVERQDRITEYGIVLKPQMQVEHVFIFQTVAGGAAVDAEFVLENEEVAAVARTLRANGFIVMAIHHHELFERPTLYYLHAFKKGAPLDLARGLRQALNQTETD